MSARWEHELGALRDVCLEKQVRTDAISSGLIHPKKESVITSSSFFLRKIPKRALSSTPNSFSDIRKLKKTEVIFRLVERSETTQYYWVIFATIEKLWQI